MRNYLYANLAFILETKSSIRLNLASSFFARSITRGCLIDKVEASYSDRLVL